MRPLDAVIPARTPFNDLQFMRDLAHGIPRKVTAQVALKAFKRHLWYLSEDLIGLSLFDERVPNDEKDRMVENFKKRERKGLKRLEGARFSPATATSRSKRSLSLRWLLGGCSVEK